MAWVQVLAGINLLECPAAEVCICVYFLFSILLHMTCTTGVCTHTHLNVIKLPFGAQVYTVYLYYVSRKNIFLRFTFYLYVYKV